MGGEDRMNIRLQNGSRDRPFQRSPDLLQEINTFFWKIDLSYHCRMGLNLLSILSLSPDSECGNWFRIKGEKWVLSPDAEISMFLGWATLDV